MPIPHGRIMVKTDIEAYQSYPGLRNWFNKLWLSEQLGYYCGPAGVAPKKSAKYIVRPIMNLVGMSAGAKMKWIDAGDNSKVEPGYFWCELFEGPQLSIDYRWVGKWEPISCWEATVDPENLYMFKKWTRSSSFIEIGLFFDEIADHNVTELNVEFVGGNAIEVHFRHSPDPDYDELIPIWEGDEKKVDILNRLGYKYISDYDDAGGNIPTPRLGFMVINSKGD